MTVSTTAPPDDAIRLALMAAAKSPCAKSKRGVAVMAVVGNGWRLLGAEYNGAPDRSCDGSDACRRDCAKRCVHAESRALRCAIESTFDLRCVQFVHVKAVDGALVAGNGPSCWQCSREILDAGIGGIWLFEYDDRHPASAVIHGKGAWRYYDALAFHRTTLDACEIGGPR